MVGKMFSQIFKVNNRNTKKICEIWSKLTLKTREQRRWRRSAVFIGTFWIYFTSFSSVSIVDFDQENVLKCLAQMNKINVITKGMLFKMKKKLNDFSTHTKFMYTCVYHTVSEFFWSVFFVFRLNTERYFVSLCIQSKCKKIRTRIIPNTETFPGKYCISTKCMIPYY